MNAKNLSQLLLDTDQIMIKEIIIGSDEIGLVIESTIHKAACPKCQEESNQIHSTYMRYPADLAWAEWAVVLHIQVKRFFCRNESCPKRTFAERFPDLVARYARRTERVVKRQQQISLNVCARIAERLLLLGRIGISDTTVNRLIRSLPDPEILPLRVVGIDDWAKLKGQQYGTILVDLERGEIIDILQDRTAETAAQWLAEHPEIEIVSRDRAQAYATAIKQGAPEAIQVADRWHLLKNISDTVFKILEQEYVVIQQQLKAASKQNDPVQNTEELLPTHPPEEPEQLTPAEQRRGERMACARKLHRQGWTQKRIAKHLNVHPKTIRRDLRATSPKNRRNRTGSLLGAFKPYIIQRWNEGCRNAAQLFREIEPQGYAGKVTMVRLFVRHLRQVSQGEILDTDPTQRLPSLRKLTWFILKRPEKRSEQDEHLLAQISAGQQKLTATIQLARELAELIREQDASELDPWLDKTSKSKFQTWKSFAASIQQDYAAVRAALLYPWSNGPTEGHINRLKCWKRQMYGRAKDDLLRKRMLWQGRWSFT